MIGHTLHKLLRSLKSIIVYQPPDNKKTFVLSESANDNMFSSQELLAKIEEFNSLLAQTKKIFTTTKSLAKLIGKTPEQVSKVEDSLQTLMNHYETFADQVAPDCSSGLMFKDIFVNLEVNKSAIDRLYGQPNNFLLISRDFDLSTSPPTKATLVFLEGMVDKKIIDLAVLQPLTVHFPYNQPAGPDFVQKLAAFIPAHNIKPTDKYKDLVAGINKGETALLIDGFSEALLIDTKGFKTRSVDRPQMEQSVRGSQMSFDETLTINISLVRLLLKTSDLMVEPLVIGTRSQDECSILYLKSVANPKLVNELRRRLYSLNIDFAGGGTLEQFIEDSPVNPFPQTLTTERPDRVAAHLAEGRIAILQDNNPFAIIAPISLFTLFHSSEDFALKAPVGNFMRLLRLSGAVLTLLMPSMYLAISYYHQEAIPTELLLAIAGARELVPFPAFLEVLFMEISLELVREAGLRIPGMLGSTIGIVGAIILGQAVVAANVISPITVVIVAVTGLASFAITDYRLAFAVRLVRFPILTLAATLGLIGVGSGLLVLLEILSVMKSFGVPYLAPMAPQTATGADAIIRYPVFEQESRPDELQPLDRRRQPKISRLWIKRPGKGD